ncbi:MAG: hypothetical protein ACRELA_23935 [Candidatus Rokuibacteriota bacterium]
MNGEAESPRWLIIVRRDQLDLYRNLREAFAGVPRVAVILDRRQRERRETGTPAKRDQRHRQRRQSLTATEHDLWRAAGFRLIHTAEDLRVYEVQDPPR